MKKFFLAAVAATMLTAPTLGAQAAPMAPMVRADATVQTINHQRGNQVTKKTVIKRKANGKIVKRTVTTHTAKKHRWARGHRVNGWRNYRAVDYHRYHLRRPPHGHRWVRVNDDFLLIAIGSGVIASIIAAH